MVEITFLSERPDTLGESPIWCPERQCLYWIDVEEGRISRWDERNGAKRLMDLHLKIGSIGLCTDGRLIAAMRDGFGVIDPLGQTFRWVGDNSFLKYNATLNDSKVDAGGRFWNVGLQVDPGYPPAQLVSLQPDLTVRFHDDGFVIGNGIAFAPDGCVLYAADTRSRAVYAYDLDPDRGAISNKRLFIQPDESRGRVDGATCDSEGNYWVAMVGGGAIECYAPDGTLLERIAVPVPLPTMVMFGGADYDEMFVTTSRLRLSAEALLDAPNSGCLLRLTGVGAKGQAEPRFPAKKPLDPTSL